VTPRLVFLILLLAAAVVGVVCASGSHTVIGLGALGWAAVWYGGIVVDMVLRQEWPTYTARKAQTP
jgi:hypothetical protein